MPRACAIVAREIDEFQQRVGRRLDPDEAGVGTDRGFQRRRVGEIDVGGVEAGGALAHAFEQAARAAVEIVDRDDMRAVIQTFEHGRDRGEPGREGKRRAAAFEVGDAALERHAGGIFRARVVEAFVHARALLHEGRGGVDRHHHRAGRRIGRLAGVHAAGGEVEPVGQGHRGAIRK
jgi:hypothetical protein